MQLLVWSLLIQMNLLDFRRASWYISVFRDCIILPYARKRSLDAFNWPFLVLSNYCFPRSTIVLHWKTNALKMFSTRLIPDERKSVYTKIHVRICRLKFFHKNITNRKDCVARKWPIMGTILVESLHLHSLDEAMSDIKYRAQVFIPWKIWYRNIWGSATQLTSSKREANRSGKVRQTITSIHERYPAPSFWKKWAFWCKVHHPLLLGTHYGFQK